MFKEFYLYVESEEKFSITAKQENHYNMSLTRKS